MSVTWSTCDTCGFKAINLKNYQHKFVDCVISKYVPCVILSHTRTHHFKYLHAENNNIEEISLAVGVLTNLKGLWLSRNQLQWLPNEVLKCRDLENLDIDHNFIEELPTGIENMPKLR